MQGKTMLRIGSVVACLAAASQAAAAQELGPVDPWGGFDKGAAVRVTVSTQFEAPVGAQPQDQIAVRKLLRLTDDAAEVETATVQGRELPRTDKTRRDVAGVHPLAGEPGGDRVRSRKSGEEEIRAAGRAFRCEVWEISIRKAIVEGNAPSDVEDVVKLWHSKEVPGGIVKIEATLHLRGIGKLAPSIQKIDGGIEALDEKVKVEFAGNEREISCTKLRLRLETTGGRPGKGKEEIWLSNEVPGKVARRVREFGEPGSRVFVTTTAAVPAVEADGKEGDLVRPGRCDCGPRTADYRSGGACGRCGAGIDKRDRLCGGCARALGVCPWCARKK
jgi:hypothetical protein